MNQNVKFGSSSLPCISAALHQPGKLCEILLQTSARLFEKSPVASEQRFMYRAPLLCCCEYKLAALKWHAHTFTEFVIAGRRLNEHKPNINSCRNDHLTSHCQDCGCVLLFTQCTVFARHKSMAVRGMIGIDMSIKISATYISEQK